MKRRGKQHRRPSPRPMWRYYKPFLEALEDRLPPGDATAAGSLPDGDPSDTALLDSPLDPGTDTPAPVGDEEDTPTAPADVTDPTPDPVAVEREDDTENPTEPVADDQDDDPAVLQDVLLVDQPFPVAPPEGAPPADAEPVRPPRLDTGSDGGSATGSDGDSGTFLSPTLPTFDDFTIPALSDTGASTGTPSTDPVTFTDETEERFLLTSIPASVTATSTAELAIPDTNTAVTSSIVVSGQNRSVSDVDVTVNISHPRARDLAIVLISPNNQRITLVNPNQVAAGDEGFVDTTFDQQATTAITAAPAPFTGRFRPVGNLDSLSTAGASHPAVDGNWRLELRDAVASEEGTLLDWSVTFSGDGDEKDLGVGDLNQDGVDDLIIARKRPFSLAGTRPAVLMINEGGVLVDRTPELAPGFIETPIDARDVVLGDFTGDGWLDVVFATTFGQQPQFYHNLGADEEGNWLGLTNESEARIPFLTPAELTPNPAAVGFPRFCAVTAGDVTGDGHLDLYFSGYVGPGGAAFVRDILLINNGEGIFTNETAQRLGNYANSDFGTVAAIDDINGDGANDIIKVTTLGTVAPFGNRGVFVLYNPGDGVFHNRPFQTVPGTTGDVYMFAMGDLNNDGRKDIYSIHDSQDHVNLNTGNDAQGRIIWQQGTVSVSPRTTGFGGNAQMVDINGDGFQDITVSPIDVDIANCPTHGVASPTQRFALLLNAGTGVPATQLRDPWPLAQTQNIHQAAHDFTFIDLNGDGKMDIIQALCHGYRVFMQE